MPLESWDEVRTAWQVVRAGTVSGAAEALGVHHATVIRHIDALESRLGVKLFQRHPRGYTPTEAGLSLAQVGRATDEQFAQLVARLMGADDALTGDLVITTLAALAPALRPAIALLAERHPDLTLRLRTDHRVLRLEYGEAHIAVRAGPRPVEPDNVVQPLMTIRPTLYASPAYIERHGLPANDAELVDHRFVVEDGDTLRAPHTRWLVEHQPALRFAFRSSEASELRAAIAGGLGLGFLYGTHVLPEMVAVFPPRPEWESMVWLVTHVDLHRTPKVQAALAAIKETLGA